MPGGLWVEFWLLGKMRDEHWGRIESQGMYGSVFEFAWNHQVFKGKTEFLSLCCNSNKHSSNHWDQRHSPAVQAQRKNATKKTYMGRFLDLRGIYLQSKFLKCRIVMVRGWRTSSNLFLLFVVWNLSSWVTRRNSVQPKVPLRIFFSLSTPNLLSSQPIYCCLKQNYFDYRDVN